MLRPPNEFVRKPHRLQLWSVSRAAQDDDGAIIVTASCPGLTTASVSIPVSADSRHSVLEVAARSGAGVEDHREIA